jgi:WD40 repeat protein
MGVWDVKTANRVRSLISLPNREQSAKFDAVCVSADTRFIVIGRSQGNTVQIWSVQTGILVAEIEGSSPVSLSPDGRFLLCGAPGRSRDLQLWELEWDWTFPDPAEWDEEARPFLEFFLTRHTPYARGQLNGVGMFRAGMPGWTEEDFGDLLGDLGIRGFGWLRPDGVARKLDELRKTL